jgi:hypothetical protein
VGLRLALTSCQGAWWHKTEILTNTYKAHATDGDNSGLIDIHFALVYHMKRFASLASLTVAALLSGCAVYPDGTPMYGNGGGYSSYPDYDGYAAGVPVVPQTNVYMGYSNYYGPGYYNGPGRYYGPGPGYGGYPDHGNNGGWHGQPNGGGSRGGPPPQPQSAVSGPRGPSGSNAPRPGTGNPPPPPQQAGNGGSRGNGGGNNGSQGRGWTSRPSGSPTEH